MGPSDNLEDVTKPVAGTTAVGRSTKWWESKLAAVVAGAVATYFLAPIIQDQFELNRWKRQAQFEGNGAAVSATANFLTELAVLNAYVSVFDKLAWAATSDGASRLGVQEFQKIYLQQYRDWRMQTAKVAGTLVLFDEFVSVRKDFQAYVVDVERYMAAVRDRGAAGDRRGYLIAQQQMGEINALYESLRHQCQDELLKAKSANQRSLKK